MRNETDHTAAMAFVKDGIDGGDSVSSVAAVYEAVNELMTRNSPPKRVAGARPVSGEERDLNEQHSPPWQRRGGRAFKKMVPFL